MREYVVEVLITCLSTIEIRASSTSETRDKV